MTAVKVKICGMTRTVDICAAVEAGVDALGFVFTPRSKRFVAADGAAALVSAVPAFVSRVGLFMDQSTEVVLQVLGLVRLNLLQFHGSEPAEFCEQFGLPYIKAIGMGAETEAGSLCAAYPGACGVLLDSHEPGHAGGTGHVFDWNRIPAIDKPLVLAGGLNRANVARAVRAVQPWAVDVSSGVEDAPGIKNHERMREFIEEAKREN